MQGHDVFSSWPRSTDPCLDFKMGGNMDDPVNTIPEDAQPKPTSPDPNEDFDIDVPQTAEVIA